MKAGVLANAPNGFATPLNGVEKDVAVKGFDPVPNAEMDPKVPKELLAAGFKKLVAGFSSPAPPCDN